MTYTLQFAIVLGSGDTGLTLNAQRYDTAGSNSGTAITTGFAEIGNGHYTLNLTTIPDDFRGGIKFYESGVPGTILATCQINPEEGETVTASYLLSYAVEGAYSFLEYIRLLAAALVWKSDGGGGAGTKHFRDSADTKNRITGTVDADGNRTSVSVDGS